MTDSRQRQDNRDHHLRSILEIQVRMHRLFPRVSSEQELIGETCRLLTGGRGYSSAWIMLLDRRWQPVRTAASGPGPDTTWLKQTLAAGHPPRCLMEILAGATLVLSRRSREFCRSCPLRDMHRDREVMTTAIRHRNRLYGVLTITLPTEVHRDRDEQEMVRAIGADIGFALHNLDQQQLRRQTEIELKKSNKRLEDAQEMARMGYWEIDLASGRISGSRETYRILERDPNRPLKVREDFRRLLHPSDRERARTAMDDLIKNGTPYDQVYRVSMPGGGWKHLHMKARLHRDDQGRPIRVMGIMQDVSLQKQMEQQLLQAEKMATIAGLAAGVAHELNTPLSAILQSLQVINQLLDPDNEAARTRAEAAAIDLVRLRDYLAESRIRFFLDGIRDSAGKAARIINSLLQFSRPRKGEFSRVNIREMFETVIDLCRADYTLKKKYRIMDIDLKIDIPPDQEPILIHCLSMEIEQVLLNLIKNAAHALSEPGAGRPGRITLRAEQSGQLVRIEVEDNGAGIDPEILPRIFEPFTTSKDIGVGTGLGLAVVYAIIHDHHQGTIEARSSPGRGTTIIIHLPQEPAVTGERS